MTEHEIRETVVTQARSWLGLNESDGSYKKIVDLYNAISPLPVGYTLKATDPWCAAFVSAVGSACGLESVLLPECSCSRMIGLYKVAGEWVEDDAYIPSPGDIIMYGWDDSGKGDYTGDPDHTGIVEDCDGKTITIIEGNKNDAVERRIIAVNARYIRGFCLPDYGSRATRPGKRFSDVPDGRYYSEAVNWLADQNIVSGFEDGSYRPDEPLTRGQAAIIAYRALRKQIQ